MFNFPAAGDYALDLLFSARLIDAAEALRIGLVNRVLPQAELMDGVRAYARELATAVSPRSLRVMKLNLPTLASELDTTDQFLRELFLR